MQSVSSRIWTRVAVSISYGDNHYTTGTSWVSWYNQPNECPGYDTKQFDDGASVMLELWGMRSTRLSPSLPGLLGPGVVASDRVLCIDQIELNYVISLNWIVWTSVFLYLTVCLNCVLMLNWIFLNRTFLTFNCVYTKVYLY